MSLDSVANLVSCPKILQANPGRGWLLFRTSAKISDFLTPSPLVRKFTQPPLLRLLTMSAFEGDPCNQSICSQNFKYFNPST